MSDRYPLTVPLTPASWTYLRYLAGEIYLDGESVTVNQAAKELLLRELILAGRGHPVVERIADDLANGGQQASSFRTRMLDIRLTLNMPREMQSLLWQVVHLVRKGGGKITIGRAANGIIEQASLDDRRYRKFLNRPRGRLRLGASRNTANEAVQAILHNFEEWKKGRVSDDHQI